MDITIRRIAPSTYENSSLRAEADITLVNADMTIDLDHIKVLECRPKTFFISFPSYRTDEINPHNESKNIYVPYIRFNKETHTAIERAVVSAYKSAMGVK